MNEIERLVNLETKTLAVIVDGGEADNPREGDYTLGTMLAYHNRYNMGDDTNYDPSDYNGWEDFEKNLRKDNDIAVLLPLYMYEHSSVQLYTTPVYGFDYGRLGFIFIDKETVRKTYNCKRITKAIVADVTKLLEAEVDIYSKYFNGEIYGFQTYKLTDEEVEQLQNGDINIDEIDISDKDLVDCCYGYIGLEHIRGSLKHDYNMTDEIKVLVA